VPQGNSSHNHWAGHHYQGAGAGVIVVVGQPRGLVVMAHLLSLNDTGGWLGVLALIHWGWGKGGRSSSLLLSLRLAKKG